MDTYKPIHISDEAQIYLSGLLAKKAPDKYGIRIFVNRPGTPQAETCLSYCKEEDHEEGDEIREFPGFKLFTEQQSVKFLDQALIDYTKDSIGGQLTIKAPCSRLPKLNADSTIEERLNHTIWNEINPMLAAHGGQVALLEVTDEMKAVLEFGGGCQGCGMVDMTLKQGIETTLCEAVPELTGVVDITDHSYRDNAWDKS